MVLLLLACISASAAQIAYITKIGGDNLVNALRVIGLSAKKGKQLCIISNGYSPDDGSLRWSVDDKELMFSGASYKGGHVIHKIFSYKLGSSNLVMVKSVWNGKYPARLSNGKLFHTDDSGII